MDTTLIPRAPIVLAHGLFGFERIGLGRWTFARYFRGIPEYLRSLGCRVATTRVPAIARVSTRARRLAEAINAAFPGERVHVFGHSMGGLDTRVLLSDASWTGRILSLTAIGTPHLGSTLADFAALRAGRVYRLLDALGIEHGGFLDVRSRDARNLDLSLRPPAGVACFSVAGTPEPSDVCLPLRRLHEVLLEVEGPNDGLVSAASAEAFGKVLPRRPLDHLRQMNWLPPHHTDISSSVTPDPLPVPVHESLNPRTAAFYAALVANLVEHGFAAETRSELVATRA